MLAEYFGVAYHPIGPESEKPMTAINEVYVPGVFGNIFDVIYAYPDVSNWRTIDTYPVVIAAGEIELTAAEGQRLAQYVERGGTLLVADGHLTGPGVGELKLPATGDVAEADSYRWRPGEEAFGPVRLDAAPPTGTHVSPRFRFRPIPEPAGRPLATTPEGSVFCMAIDRGEGRLIYLSVSYGLSITRRPTPVLALLLGHLTRGLLPAEVDGDVEWLLNRTADGWLVTLLNPAGQVKPQQGITPTDYRQNRSVTIRSQAPLRTARDRLLESEALLVEGNAVRCEVPAGGVRVVELK
jgi:hypothetical protein